MSNFNLVRPQFVGLVSTASAYSCSTYTLAMTTGSAATLGSIREINFELSADTLKATSSKSNDATVATSVASVAGTITVTLEEITSSAHKYLFDMSASGANLYSDGAGGVPTDYACISYPWNIDGSANCLVAYACNIEPGSVRKLGKEQELLELKLNVLVRPDASASKRFFGFLQKDV